jgi:hypothetical protein
MYMKRVSIFLIMVALIASMVSCGAGGGGAESYTLTIYGTVGGIVTVNNVTILVKTVFAYNPGTVVSLNASPSANYRFVSWIGNVSSIADTTAAVATITMNGNYNITALFEANFMVAPGIFHTVGLKSDGTVVAVGSFDTTPVLGENLTGWLDVGNWTHILQVAAGSLCTLGLESNGTVVVAAPNYTQIGINATWFDVGNWTDIIQVSEGAVHTVGLESDETVIAVGDDSYGQCDIGAWTHIVQVSAGSDHTVGLESNGAVVAVGDNSYGQCDVGNWTGIVQVSAGWFHTVGLKCDGTVIAVGDNSYGQCDVGNWTDIVQVSAGGTHTVGLKADGTVVAVGWNGYGQCDVGNWTDIIQVAAAGGNGALWYIPGWMWGGNTLGVRSDGTVVAVGINSSGQCNVSGWDLN